MTNNTPNLWKNTITKWLSEYSYSPVYTDGNLEKSLSAQNLDGVLINWYMSVFQSVSTEWAEEKITMVEIKVENQEIIIDTIEVDADHNISLSISIGGVIFKWEVKHTEIAPRWKKNPPIHTYEIQYESEKVEIWTKMVTSWWDTIEIDQLNIDEYNKRILRFTWLLVHDDGEDYFELADWDLTDLKNQSVEVIKSSWKFKSYVYGIITGAVLLFWADHFQKDITERINQTSNEVVNSLNGTILKSHNVKRWENLTSILTLRGITFKQTQLSSDSLRLNTILNITVDGENNLISINDPIDWTVYTK